MCSWKKGGKGLTGEMVAPGWRRMKGLWGPLGPPFLLASDRALAMGGELQARWWPHGGRQGLFLEQIYGSACLSHEILLKLRETVTHWWPADLSH